MEFLQIQFKTHQHCKVSCSSTAGAVRGTLVAGMSSDKLHRHSVGQPSPSLSRDN